MEGEEGREGERGLREGRRVGYTERGGAREGGREERA